MVYALDGGCARRHAGGQHHLHETSAQQVLRAHALAQAQGDACQTDLFAKVAQGLKELFFARHLLGDIELPADLAGGVK